MKRNFLGLFRHQTKALAGTGWGFGPTAGSPVMMKSLGMVLVGAAATVLEKRRKLMDAWSAYCEPKSSANIVQLRNF